MAEINELLSRAADEAEGLADQATRARETVEEILRLGTTLNEAVEAVQAEGHERLDHLTSRLADAQQQLSREGASARAALLAVLTRSRGLQADAAAFGSRVETELDALRAERDRALAEAEGGADAVEAATARHRDRLQELEAEAEARLVQGREDIARLRALAEAARRDSSDKTARLVAQLQTLEDRARLQLQTLVHAYESTAGHVEEQLGEGLSALRERSEETQAALDGRLAHDVLERLARAVAPLRDALSGLTKATQASRDRQGQHLGVIGQRIQEIIRALDTAKAPLETVRHHLS
jgi:hypothetical protein